MSTVKENLLLILEGNIGAGKSTFLRILKEHLNVDVIPEPTDKWQKIGSGKNNLLDLFYKDTSRWSYTFQSYAFISRIQTFLEYRATTPTSGPQILERSVYCDRYCFAKNCFEMETMNALEWQIYKEWFSWLVENYTPKPHGFVYLRTSPEVCHKRLVKRNRKEELNVSLSYLQSLHKKHEDWLIEKKDVEEYLLDIPVLTLECNEEFENNTKVRNALLTKVDDFIQSLNIIPPQSKMGQKAKQLSSW